MDDQDGLQLAGMEEAQSLMKTVIDVMVWNNETHLVQNLRVISSITKENSLSFIWVHFSWLHFLHLLQLPQEI